MSVSVSADDRPRLWRSRWAAIGAAVAVTFGGGGLFAVSAASPESSVVSIEPVRILDTRDPVNVGLAGPFVSPVSQDLKVTGSVPTTTGTKVVVPAGATGVFLNVTPVGSTAAGFISVRPANAAGLPSTSNVNFTVGAINPNAVLVELPVGGADDGKIEITFDAFGAAGPTSDVLVDVVGYTSASRLAALEATKADKADVYTKAQIDASVANTLKAGGAVSTTGTTGTGASIGTWTSTKNAGTGSYSLSFPGLRPGCAASFPLIMFSSQTADHTVRWTGGVTSCGSGDVSVSVATVNGANAASDAAFNFVIYMDAASPLSPGQLASSEYTTCTVQPDAEPVCT